MKEPAERKKFRIRKKHIYISSIPLGLLLFLLGYRLFYYDAVADALKERFNSSTAHLIKSLPSETLDRKALKKVYEKNGNIPFWFGEEGVNPQAWALLGSIAHAEDQGLNPNLFHYPELQTFLEAASKRPAKNWSADSLADLDLLLTDAFCSYAKSLYAGYVSQGGMNVNRSRHLAKLSLTDALKDAIENKNMEHALEALLPKEREYKTLQEKLLFFHHLAERTQYPQLPTKLQMKTGDTSAWLGILYSRLKMTGEIPESTLTPARFDKATVKIIKELQHRYGRDSTGKLDEATIKSLNVPLFGRIRQIELNMERLRWLPHEDQQTIAWVNIADYHMEIHQAQKTVVRMGIIVGKPFTQTPIFDANMNSIIINPYWDVPYSIATKELLPILKRNPGYLARNHMLLYAGGAEINPYGVDWSGYSKSYFPFHIRQKPGNWNALGNIKFLFPNPYSVYMHGTPNQELFSRKVRTFSHGCIRLEKPMELALFLLGNQPAWTESRIRKIIAGKQETYIPLQASIPVFVTYQTAWVDEKDKLHFRDDIYGRDALLDKLLPENAPINL